MQIKENKIVLENRERNETNTVTLYMSTQWHEYICIQWHGSWLVSEAIFSVTVSKSVENYLFLNVF